MSEIKAVEFVAEVRQVKTGAEHSVYVVLNLGEDQQEQAKKFIDWLGQLVHCVVVIEEPDNRMVSGKSKRRKPSDAA